jgi:nucleoside-diphosphate-sugar epimerase
MTRTALVTGTNGALGRAIARALEQRGWHVVEHRGRADGDLTTPEGARSAVAAPVTLIVNAAGVSYGSPSDLWRANALIPMRLAEATEGVLPQARLILIGSAAVYGLATTPATRFREDGPLQPNSEYGMSKLAAERLGRAIHPDTVTARIFNVSGVSAPGTLLARVQAAATGGDPLPQGAGDIRDWVTPEFIGDAVAAIAAAADVPDAVNVCTGEGRSPAALLGVSGAHEPRSWSVGDPALLRALMRQVGYSPDKIRT